MKSIQITGYGNIADNTVLADVPVPEITKSEVLIEVYAAAVNPIDYKIIEGALKQIKPLNFPAPIGFDLSGKVKEIGSEVKDLAVGDEVFARVPTGKEGTFAEYIAVDSQVVAIKPKNISFEEASGFPLTGLTSMQAFDIAGLKAGDKVLIHAGSGGIGTFAIQYAKAKGAYVYTTTSTANVDWVKALGADRVIDYKKENYLDVVHDIDIVYDTLGGEYSVDAFKIIRKGGKVVSIAGPLDSQTAKDFGLNFMIQGLLALKRRKVSKGMKKKSALYRYFFMKPDRSQLNEIASLVDSGKIRPVTAKIFSLSEGIEALQFQKTGRAKGKVIIKIK